MTPRPVAVHERMGSLRTLAAALEATDPATAAHSRRVARYSTLVGARLGLAAEMLGRLHTAATLHDIGKTEIPPDILHQPRELSENEYALVRAHAERGAEMLAEAGADPELVAIVRHHHERLDGTGYPGGLSGRAIPFGARVIAVADTFDAVASRRPYRRAGSFDQALGTLIAAAGSQLDPEIVGAFATVHAELPGLGSLDLLSDTAGGLLRRLPRSPRPGPAPVTAETLRRVA
jgi:putative nucleotidyltransferase with HDIG domain